MATPVAVGPLTVGDGSLVIVAGPCMLESSERVLRVARGLAEASQATGLPVIFKGSFDKANRTSGTSPRGPGLDAGLAMLAAVRAETGLPVTTDIHAPDQATPAAEVVDLIQIPAFLCRQTDLLLAAGRTGRPVNLKKGPFLAPTAVAPAVAKLRDAGASGVMVTERGTTFGHGDLVVDFRGLAWMRELGVPVVFDATHSVQRPAVQAGTSGGERMLAPGLARAAVAMGVDAVFCEVHDAPDTALSDAATQLPLTWAEPLMAQLGALHRAWPADPRFG
ncbi:MAG: 3-deoxy-8-phosphooctulonate synthase [Myxococcota bacterium]